MYDNMIFEQPFIFHYLPSIKMYYNIKVKTFLQSLERRLSALYKIGRLRIHNGFRKKSTRSFGNNYSENLHIRINNLLF